MVFFHEDNELLETLLPDEKPITQAKHQNKTQTCIKGLFKQLVVVLASAIVTSLIWTAIFLALRNPSPSPPIAIDCGTSPAIAHSKGCKFQLWSYSWVPMPCFDDTLNLAFLELQAKEKWGYFTSLDSKEETDLAIVLAGNRSDLFSTWGQHYWHCAFYQRKYFRMVENSGVGKTNRDLEREHSLHCQSWLADPFKYPWDKVNINLTVGFNVCYP